jgi:hypothetical protein
VTNNFFEGGKMGGGAENNLGPPLLNVVGCVFSLFISFFLAKAIIQIDY